MNSIQNPHNTHIYIGLSGGVDSSVTALLLKEQGYRLTGVFMINWEADVDDPHCTANQDLSDARAVCDLLGIPLLTVNFAKIYWDRVFQFCLDEFAEGRTPNPDIGCNSEIKFKAFLDYAFNQGANYIATGHYARIIKDEKTGLYQLLKANDATKDQSYFLYTLNQNQLAKSLFPVGHLKKTETRALAQQARLNTFAKKDSTGICFVGERKFKDFLKSFLIAQPGPISTAEGKVIGQHDGVMFYTLGQRQGLNIGGVKGTSEKAWYVVSKNIQSNTLIVGQGQHHPLLFSKTLICKKVHWISGYPPNLQISYGAKIRYRQEEQICTLIPIADNTYQVTFEAPQRAITPGQSVVFYDRDICLGGGVII